MYFCTLREAQGAVSSFNIRLMDSTAPLPHVTSRPGVGEWVTCRLWSFKINPVASVVVPMTYHLHLLFDAQVMYTQALKLSNASIFSCAELYIRREECACTVCKIYVLLVLQLL